MYKIVYFRLRSAWPVCRLLRPPAAPIGNLSGLSNDVVQVQHRMICDQRGRCYRAAPRNARRNVMRDDYGYAPQYRTAPFVWLRAGLPDGSPGVGIGIGGFGIGVGPRW